MSNLYITRMNLAQSPLIAVLLALVCSCAAQASNNTTGKATVYSDAYDGKKTATGAIYKSQAVSGASNSLPLGSKVLVTNKKTGKHAVVVINDKMGKHAAAVLDLSKGAAHKLGVHGTAPVEAKVIGH